MKSIKDKICKNNLNKNKLTRVNLSDSWHRGWDQDKQIERKLKKIMKPNKKTQLKKINVKKNDLTRVKFSNPTLRSWNRDHPIEKNTEPNSQQTPS